MSAPGEKFSCGGCGRSYLWKPELAGRKVKCKCGHVMSVPQAWAPEPAADDDAALYELAEMEFNAAATLPPMVVAAAPVSPAPAPRKSARPGVAHPAAALGYKRGPSAREREITDSLIDMTRDVYAPTGLLVGGLLIYVAYYALRYNLGATGIAATAFGLGLMTAFKAAFLVGFALVVAGPLGVSFGGLWTAILKLAAIAVFCDGITTWVDAGVAKMSGGFGSGGAFGPGIIGWPVALGIYWGLLIYLFSMDPGDSWMVVVILSVFDYIVKWVLGMILLGMILGWGGVSLPSAGPGIGGGKGGASSAAMELIERVNEGKDNGALREARRYITDGHQAIMTKFVDDWYTSGAKNVWFEVSRDINGKTEPHGLVVELPTDKSRRAKCLAAIKAYYDEQKISYDAEDLKDTGAQYLEVELP